MHSGVPLTIFLATHRYYMFDVYSEPSFKVVLQTEACQFPSLRGTFIFFSLDQTYNQLKSFFLPFKLHLFLGLFKDADEFLVARSTFFPSLVSVFEIIFIIFDFFFDHRCNQRR